MKEQKQEMTFEDSTAPPAGEFVCVPAKVVNRLGAPGLWISRLRQSVTDGRLKV